jgi:uncharacterized repeat protein (TIGR02543 family)
MLALLTAVALCASLFPANVSATAGGESLNVTVSVETFTVDGEYIVEPTRMTLAKNTSASIALVTLLKARFPDVKEPCRSWPGYSYITGIWDPAYRSSLYPGYLNEFDEGLASGWKYAVNNVFPNVGASTKTLNDGDVMRWQYTKTGLGADLDAQADKDALTERVAEIRAAGRQGAYGEVYANALAALKDLNSTQDGIDALCSEIDALRPEIDARYPQSGEEDIVNSEAKQYTVTFDANGGKGLSVKSVSVTEKGRYGKPATVKRTGYRFLGWYTEKKGGRKVTAGSAIAKNADHTLYAQWKANRYQVTLNANGGKVSGKKSYSKTVTFDKVYGALKKAVRPGGYKFTGWYTKRSGGVKVTAGTKVSKAGKQTLYARWQARYGEPKKGVSVVKVRAGTAAGSRVIGYISRSVRARVTEKMSGGWYRVSCRDAGSRTIRGYVYADLIRTYWR